MKTEAKHTPGPWGTNGSHIYAPDGAIIAMVNNPGSKASDYPLVANRDLMASAPYMLAALKEALTFAEGSSPENVSGGIRNSDLRNSLHAAISKADDSL